MVSLDQHCLTQTSPGLTVSVAGKVTLKLKTNAVVNFQIVSHLHLTLDLVHAVEARRIKLKHTIAAMETRFDHGVNVKVTSQHHQAIRTAPWAHLHQLQWELHQCVNAIQMMLC